MRYARPAQISAGRSYQRRHESASMAALEGGSLSRQGHGWLLELSHYHWPKSARQNIGHDHGAGDGTLGVRTRATCATQGWRLIRLHFLRGFIFRPPTFDDAAARPAKSSARPVAQIGAGSPAIGASASAPPTWRGGAGAREDMKVRPPFHSTGPARSKNAAENLPARQGLRSRNDCFGWRHSLAMAAAGKRAATIQNGPGRRSRTTGQ